MSLVGISLYLKTQVPGVWLRVGNELGWQSPVPKVPGTRCLAQGRENKLGGHSPYLKTHVPGVWLRKKMSLVVIALFPKDSGTRCLAQ